MLSQFHLDQKEAAEKYEAAGCNCLVACAVTKEDWEEAMRQRGAHMTNMCTAFHMGCWWKAIAGPHSYNPNRKDAR